MHGTLGMVWTQAWDSRCVSERGGCMMKEMCKHISVWSLKCNRQGKTHLQKWLHCLETPASLLSKDNQGHYHSVETSIKIFCYSVALFLLFCFSPCFWWLFLVFFVLILWILEWFSLSPTFSPNQTRIFTGNKLDRFVWLEGKCWIEDIHIHPTFCLFSML